MSKRSIAATAALVAVALIAGTGPAQAKSRTKTIEVHTHYTEPAAYDYGVQCAGVLTLAPACVAHVYGTATFTGTMWGDVSYDNYGSATPDGKLTYEGPDYIDGGVIGCGTGTYIIEDTKGYVDMSQFDPLTNSAPAHNEWHLRAGSGTGELTNLVSGSGENHWREYFVGKDGDSTKAGEGDFTGTITCRVP